jgi:hypothetical protein
MYKNRILREDLSTGEAQFYDDAAVFVGRIVKEVETDITLLRRFSKYGPIVSVFWTS